ncbi:hypothetical protein BJV74DRAFT_889347 [Russula compacta]|nr:hypothetical protein BJV74DRAFT_889347 [Russula compacta]
MAEYPSHASLQAPYRRWSSTLSELAPPPIVTDFNWDTGYTLYRAVGHLWPDLQGWIMLQAPTDMDANGSSQADSIEASDYAAIIDPDSSQRHSTLERVGFSMSPEAFSTARALMQIFAACCYSSEDLLDCDINPFFLIYVCAECDLPLPNGFSRKLFWKHLDGIVRAQCWRGLISVQNQASTSTVVHGGAVAATRLNFSQQDDPEAIVNTLVARLENTVLPPEPTGLTLYSLKLAISGSRWEVSSRVGTFRHDAVDLGASMDVASFALLDTLTRLLSRWQGGILQVDTNDICVMWGVRGMYSGMWHVVRAICKEHGVQLRVRLAEKLGFHVPPQDDYVAGSPKGTLRNPSGSPA